MTSVLKVDNVQNFSGTSAMSIDSSGRVLKPQQIAFKAFSSTGGSVSYSGGNVVSASMTSTKFNVGSHYQTSGTDVGKFIAPITGYYFIGCNLFNNTSGVTRVGIRDSNGDYVAGQGQVNAGTDININTVVYLSANDKIFIESIYSSTIYQGDDHAFFYGHFIG